MLVLTEERKGLATSMNCSGFDNGKSVKRPQKNTKSLVLVVILVIFIYDVHLRSVKHFFFSLCVISSPASTPLPPLLSFVPDYFLIIVVFLSHVLCGSSVIIIFFGMRMSFHWGTGGGRVGGSSGQTRVLVIRTMWLCSREKPY